MSAMILDFICTKSKQGYSLGQISELTRSTIDQTKEILAQATGLTPANVSIISHLKQRGLSLEQINQETGVGLKVLELFLSEDIEETCTTHGLADLDKEPYEISLGERAYTLGSPKPCKTYSSSPPTPTEETKLPPQPTKTLLKPQHTPTFFYSCRYHSNQLLRVNLLTGEQSCHEVPNYQFRGRWSELPGGSLLITGGGGTPIVSDVVRIDTRREFAVSHCPPMHTARWSHAAVYHSRYFYVLGGYNDIEMRECERYACAESRWEVLPALPVTGHAMSAVELDNDLYVFGGYVGRSFLDTIQKLSLSNLTWELMRLKLPQACYAMSCFKIETQMYLVIEETLYSFTPLQVKEVKTLPQAVWCFSSYYSRGTLYYEWGQAIESLAVGI
jgi:hypothetical protein